MSESTDLAVALLASLDGKLDADVEAAWARAEARARARTAKLAAKTNPPEIAGVDGLLMRWILCDEDDALFEEIPF